MKIKLLEMGTKASGVLSVFLQPGGIDFLRTMSFSSLSSYASTRRVPPPGDRIRG